MYFQQWYQKGFLVKPKRGHSNNTQGQWWEPASLPVIIHLFTELMTVAGGRELGASSHVMSPTHAKGLGGQAGDMKCGLYRRIKHQQQPLLLHHPTLLVCCWSYDKKPHGDVTELWQVADSVFTYSCPSCPSWMFFWEIFNIFNALGLMRENVFLLNQTPSFMYSLYVNDCNIVVVFMVGGDPAISVSLIYNLFCSFIYSLFYKWHYFIVATLCATPL